MPTSSQTLIRMMPEFMISFSKTGMFLQKALAHLLVHEAHDAFDAGAVVPAAVEDHDFAAAGELLDVTLHVQLRLLTFRRRRQRNDAKDTRTHPFGQSLD